MTRPAVFLDRDGTLVDDPPPGYLGDPGQVRVFDGAADAINRLHARGFAVVVASNQAGIARGIITWDQYTAVARRIDESLAREGARLDGTYICPHAPEIDGECPCRKPRLLLYERAAADLGLDFGRSWWIGDRITDLLPAHALGGKGILVETGLGKEHHDAARREGFLVAADLAASVPLIA